MFTSQANNLANYLSSFLSVSFKNKRRATYQRANEFNFVSSLFDISMPATVWHQWIGLYNAPRKSAAGG